MEAPKWVSRVSDHHAGGVAALCVRGLPLLAFPDPSGSQHKIAAAVFLYGIPTVAARVCMASWE